MSRRQVFFAAAMLAAVSCGPDVAPLTQVMVVVDSDLASLDAVRVRIEGMGQPLEATASDLTRKPLPRSVAVVHRGGPLGPIVVIVDGLEADAPVVSQRAELSFVHGRNLMLRVELATSCVGKTCASDETCRAGACDSVRIDSKLLRDWPGMVPGHEDAGEVSDAGTLSSDAGGSDAGGGGGGGAAGGGQGGSGGATAGATGSGGSSPRPCTDCAFTGASNPHGSVACVDGTCHLTCEAGYTNADGMRSNGCEARATGFAWAPSNFDPGAASWTPAVVDKLTVNCNAVVDLGASTLPASVRICGQDLQPAVLAQKDAGPEVAVLAMRQLTVQAGSKLRFTGSRPVLIVVYGDAQIDGELDVSAIGATGGAGSNLLCSPGTGGNGQNGTLYGAGGGGGGGFGTSGGSGASAVSGPQGGGAGAVTGQTQLRPLRGGCPGGAGGKDGVSAARGGSGGGALQLTVAGTLRIGGVIAAAGGGGEFGEDVGDGGGGGGSGGALLLEATRIELSSGSWLTANGGGGGAGRFLYTTRTAGDDGAHASSSVAVGGVGSTQGGDGGHGGAGTEGAAAADSPDNSDCGGGGGGGGVGRVVLRAVDCQLGGGLSPPVGACLGH